MCICWFLWTPFWLHLPVCGQIHVWETSTILNQPALASYLFAWRVRKLRSCPLCCSSSADVWTGTGTLGCPSWRLHQCTACDPGRAGTTFSGPATGPPAGCTEAGHRWCRPRGSVKGSLPETWKTGGIHNAVVFIHCAIMIQTYASFPGKSTTRSRIFV